MSGETDLERMLTRLSPTLLDSEYVFVTFPGARYGEHAELAPVAACLEAEGLTLAVPRRSADQHGHSYGQVLRCITLGVHSSLAAVGLTAAVSGRLAEHGISANMVAGYYHDHLFVPAPQAAAALALLNDLSNGGN